MFALTPRRAQVTLLLVALCLGAPAHVRGSCTAIPAPRDAFPSALGSVSRPFATPGGEIVIRRDDPVFSATSQENVVQLRFEPPNGPTTTLTTSALPPADGTGCPPQACDATGCRCVRFALPDTDDQLGPPGDGHGLTGPLSIVVETRGVQTGIIANLQIPGTVETDPELGRFVALPPKNAFGPLVDAPPGTVLAAQDGLGHLFVPFDFEDFLVPGRMGGLAVQVQLLEGDVPMLGALAPEQVDSLSPEGLLIPSVIRPVGGEGLIGLADAAESVVRITHQQGVLPAEGGRGPVVVHDVVGFADPRKRITFPSAHVGETWAVYENDECSVFASEEACMDLNADGDESDHFLRALDLTTPKAEPITIDTVDGNDLGGDPAYTATACPYVTALGVGDGRPPYGLYRILASDQLVAFSIDASRCFRLSDAAMLHQGAFDLTRGAPIPGAERGLVRALAGPVLAYAAGDDAHPFARWLHVYDARRAVDPGPTLVAGLGHQRFNVVGHTDYSLWGYAPFGADLEHPGSIATNGRWVGFAVDEYLQGADLDGDGSPYGVALVLLDTASPGTGGELRLTGVGFGGFAAPFRLTDRWLVAESSNLGTSQRRVLVFDLENPDLPEREICAGGGGSLTPSLSDTIIPCTVGGGIDPRDDFATGPYHLNVFLPALPGGPREIDLELPLASPSDVQVRGARLAVGIDETFLGRDLDGDGAAGGKPGLTFSPGPLVVHYFDADRLTIANLGTDVLLSRHPFLQHVGAALVMIAPDVFTSGGRIGQSFFPLPASLEHDECVHARPVSAFPFVDVVNVEAATTSIDDPISACARLSTCTGFRGTRTVWYAVTPPADGMLGVSIDGSDYAAMVTVLAGPCTALRQRTCAYDAGVEMPVTAGTTYLIEIAGDACTARGELRAAFALGPPAAPTTTTLPTDGTCRAASDCAVGPACTDAACVDGACAYREQTGLALAACRIARATLPPSCDGATELAQALDHASAVAGPMLERAVDAPPRRRARLIRAARHRLARVRRIASRLWRADAVPVACKVDTRRLIDGLLAGVSTRASRGDRP